jgi:DNA-binding NtrC family response regulator
MRDSKMSVQHPNILYVGDTERGRALQAAAEARGSSVFLAEDMMDALGMYIVYFPDVVVIDAVYRYTLAQEVYMHLRSVDAKPIIVLADENNSSAWQAAEPAVRVLPYTIDRSLLLSTAYDLVKRFVTQPVSEPFMY